MIARAPLMLWLALLAVALQSLVVQTHLPSVRPVSQAQSAVAAAPGSDDRAPPGVPIDCPICLEAADAGPLLLPTAVAVAAPHAQSFIVAAPAPPAPTHASYPQPWRSRAPPSELHA